MHHYPAAYNQGVYRNNNGSHQNDERFIGPFFPFLTGLAVAPLFYGAFRPPFFYPPYPYYPPYPCRPFGCRPFYRPFY
ncbi:MULTISPECIES: hypothetical protein [Pontibacillus]|uniref:Spore coat protein n=1 Tax=Pontibacillus chungwhensis TaxID=265426 RepID=A0ABY8V2V3_9BACI|nr:MULTISPECIES: hypothetical protein [Pontibacillus]MCD5322493.1 hypothetical protein [Pontibacillus sp. HN14]WIF99778.1 hypothetical protein QNI29_09010 [Pontibacillus chungwhensis]